MRKELDRIKKTHHTFGALFISQHIYPALSGWAIDNTPLALLSQQYKFQNINVSLFEINS